MALTEQTILAEVTVLPQHNAISVRWDNLILRDNKVISRTPHRKAYSSEMQSDFLAEVEGAANYVGLIAWSTPQ
jgi:hypothetical protein